MDEENYEIDEIPEIDENELILKDIDILERTEEEIKLRIIIDDGTWKYLTLERKVLKQILEEN